MNILWNFNWRKKPFNKKQTFYLLCGVYVFFAKSKSPNHVNKGPRGVRIKKTNVDNKISGRSPLKNYFKFTDFLGVFEEVVHKG